MQNFAPVTSDFERFQIGEIEKEIRFLESENAKSPFRPNSDYIKTPMCFHTFFGMFLPFGCVDYNGVTNFDIVTPVYNACLAEFIFDFAAVNGDFQILFFTKNMREFVYALKRRHSKLNEKLAGDKYFYGFLDARFFIPKKYSFDKICDIIFKARNFLGEKFLIVFDDFHANHPQSYIRAKTICQNVKRPIWLFNNMQATSWCEASRVQNNGTNRVTLGKTCNTNIQVRFEAPRRRVPRAEILAKNAEILVGGGSVDLEFLFCQNEKLMDENAKKVVLKYSILKGLDFSDWHC